MTAVAIALIATAATGCGSSATAPATSVPEQSAPPSETVPIQAPPPSTSESTPPAPTPPPPTTKPAPRPPIVHQPVPYPASRKDEMAEYAHRHYGVSKWKLSPRMVVLHFTASGAGSEPGVHALFSSDQPNLGELPGVCAHFVVDQDGTIYQQVPLGVMCRHTIGLNHVAVGIEMIQETGSSSHWADQQILHRPAQRRGVVRLVRWLLARYHIPRRNVIGHAMAHDSPAFLDYEGWANDHMDWQPQDVAQLRRLL
jgi:hypothetical protein